MAEIPEQKSVPDLKAARETRGLSLHQVAVELHVSDAVIQALESGDYAVVGEPVFVRGHLRNYARTLGLPEAEVLAAYEHTQHKPTAPTLMTAAPQTGGMGPRAREWSMRGFTAAVILVLVALAVSWWMRRPAAPVPAVTEVPAAATAAPPAATQPMAALTDLADAGTASAPKPAAKTAVPPAVPKGVNTPTARAAKSAVATPHPAAPAQQVVTGPGDERDLTRVKFTLGAASWVEVYDNNGKRLYYDLAPAGDTLDLSGTGPLQVFLGNAPGVSIDLDGAPFDLKPFVRSDNTARFKLGAAKP